MYSGGRISENGQPTDRKGVGPKIAKMLHEYVAKVKERARAKTDGINEIFFFLLRPA